MQGIVLAAGKGTRMLPLSEYIPKPQLPFGEKRFIDYAIDALRPFVSEIIVLTRTGEDHLLDNTVHIVHGDAGQDIFLQLKFAEPHIRDDFIVLASDAAYSSSFLEALMSKHKSGEGLVTLISDDAKKFPLKLALSGTKISAVGPKLKDYDCSAPCAFMAGRGFFNYISKNTDDNWTIFQKVLNTEGVNHVASGSIYESNTLDEYFRNSRLLLGEFVSRDSEVSNSALLTSFVYTSNIKNSFIKNSIVIDSTICGERIENKIIFRGKAIYELLPKVHFDFEVSDIRHEVARNAVMALALEPLADKPGCTTRRIDSSSGTKLEYFLISAINSHRAFYSLADRIVREGRQPGCIYDFAYEAQKDSLRNRGGGKVIWGEIQLLMPLVAAQVLEHLEGRSDMDGILKRTRIVMENTSKEDVHWYDRGIELAFHLSERHRKEGDIRSPIRHYDNVWAAIKDAPLCITREIQEGYSRSKQTAERIMCNLDQGVLKATELEFIRLLPELQRPDAVADIMAAGIYLALSNARTEILFP